MNSPWLDCWLRFGAEISDGRPRRFTDPRAELEALRQGLAIRNRGTGDLLRLRGDDRIDLLHRISAVDFASAAPNAVIPALFTTDKGRILDLAWAAPTESEVVLLSGEGRAAALRSWIEKYTVLEDVSNRIEGQAGILSLIGDSAHDAIARSLGAEALGPDGFVEHGPGFLIVSEPGAPRTTVHVVLLNPADGAELLEALVSQGAVPAGELAHAQWRIETGRPRPGLDLDESLNPLEANLRDVIAWNKGCYIGQEVIARLDTYDKVRRRTAVLSSAGKPAAKGTALGVEGKAVGWMMASTERLDGAGSVGLAVVAQSLQNGAALKAEDGDEWLLERFADEIAQG